MKLREKILKIERCETAGECPVGDDPCAGCRTAQILQVLADEGYGRKVELDIKGIGVSYSGNIDIPSETIFQIGECYARAYREAGLTGFISLKEELEGQ